MGKHSRNIKIGTMPVLEVCELMMTQIARELTRMSNDIKIRFRDFITFSISDVIAVSAAVDLFPQVVSHNLAKE